MAMTWDPAQYARYGDERSRPFIDLLARVGPEVAPRLVVDVGCGDGPATLLLPRRWPQARIVGLDNSPQMLTRARDLDVDRRVQWVQGDLATWDAAGFATEGGSGGPAGGPGFGGIDVLVTNAALQWVPGHRELLPRWARALAPGGVLALQVPHNFGAPSHALMREVAAGHRRADELLPPLQRAAASATAPEYLEILAAAGLTVDAWTTTYVHVLPADIPDTAHKSVHPVLSWVRATALRPVLAVLTDDSEREAFLAEYEAALHEAYPVRDGRVLLEFERVFAVGHKAT
ncbi:trans-aconitate 2-methyltransferase [Kineosphaera limosa NBRC 100340]|uniref:Trans-aconitate 2-methyltransferase n=2 Tax=Kineosphaera TaxID=211469 RepID=K6WN77_9MICO|nr:trans-aconitate 2-methyltransferase [Kineosphaera limosa NBRC 100340]